MELVDKKSNLVALMLKELSLSIKKLALLSKKISVECRVHVQLVRIGRVEQPKIGEFKGLRRGLFMRSSKIEECRGVEVRGKRWADGGKNQEVERKTDW